MHLAALLAVLELPTPDFSALEFEDDPELLERCEEQRTEAIEFIDAESQS